MDDISITGIGSYLPRTEYTNETLPRLDQPLTPEELDRIGVHKRRWAGEGEGIAEMGAIAARRALEKAELDPEELDFILLANWTQRRYIPEFAPLLKHLLGAKRAFAYDMCCTCAGFIYGVGTAHAFLQSPRFSRALVVASETTSQRVRPGSKGTVIVGDAAGAFVLERGAPRGGKLIDYELATHGEHHGIMNIKPDGYAQTLIPQKELNALAGRSIRDVSHKLLARCKLTLEDITWIVPHSGTAGVQAMIAQHLEAPREKILTNYASLGNVSSASIPAALDDFLAQGIIRPGDRILSAAVGTGWYAAAMLYTV